MPLPAVPTDAGPHAAPPADVTVGSTASRAPLADEPQHRQGHHAVLLSASHSVLVARFRLDVRYFHDLAATNGALLNVFSGGSGLDLDIHSAAAPLANLFTDLDIGAGSRLFASDGSTGAGACMRGWGAVGSRAAANAGGAVPAARACPRIPLTPPSPTLPPGLCVPGWATTLFNVRPSAATSAQSLVGGSSGAVPSLPGCEAGSELVFFGNFSGAAQVGEGGWVAEGWAMRVGGGMAGNAPGEACLPAAVPWHGLAAPRPRPSLPRFPQCPGWRVAPLNASLPADLFAELATERVYRAPLPQGARRPSPDDAYTACRTYMGNANVGGEPAGAPAGGLVGCWGAGGPGGSWGAVCARAGSQHEPAAA